MKRVLFIMPALPGGGAEKVLIDILKNLNSSKYQLTLLLEYNDGVYTSSVPENVEIIYLYKRSNIWLERFHRGLGIIKCYHLFHSLIYQFAFKWLLRGRQFDTIVSFMEGEAVRIHSYLNKKAEKHISWIHIDFKKKHWSLDFFRNKKHEYICYSMMDNIVFVSDDARRSFLDVYNIDARKCKIIYNLIDKEDIIQLSQTQEIKKDDLTICMVGRLNPQKRYDRALQAVKQLKEGGYKFQLWILGIGELEQELKSQCETLGVSDVCQFKGFVKPPYPYMNEADIFLNTSEAEGYPLVLCEALCLGLPIVATDITGAHEILDQSRYGILVKENVDDICIGVQKLLEDKDLRKEYSNKALLRSEMFSVQSIIKDIDNIL